MRAFADVAFDFDLMTQGARVSVGLL